MVLHYIERSWQIATRELQLNKTKEAFPYEFLAMLPYILVIVVLAFNRKSNKFGPAALGKPFNRELRV